jgi:photosystem II stability/assembly factor-like uncharacterized protein
MSARVVLLIGTKRGLFIARSDEVRRQWTLTPPLLAGREIFHAILDPRDRRTAWAASNHAVWGAHVHRSDDGGETWDVLEHSPHFADERGLIAIWALAPGPARRPDTLFAGIEPAGLFASHDRGVSWHGIDALNDHPTRHTWQPAGGGLALHSMTVDPSDERRLYCAISAGGVYRSDDEGATWRPVNAGTRAEFLPDRFPATGQCVHKLLLHPARPERLYQQNHCGVYRSDDRGESWTEITAGLPSEFGYAIALDHADPDTLFVIPEESSHMRTTVDGALRVYRSSDGGRSWRAAAEGLPQRDAYVSILREGMAADTLEPCGLYFGTSGGHLFASGDRGASWRMIAGFLPRILSVTAAVLPD